jgi:uncharacterized protein YijF (DUF1287 family)
MKRLLVPVLALLALALQAQWASADTPQDALVRGALQQVGVTLHYDGRYQQIDYPGGDVPVETGVCTDVIIRAYRSVDVDLQVLVHQDMHAAFGSYPKLWGLKRPDSNIDHRRVPNLATFFQRHGRSLPVSNNPDDYLPGDIVTWRLSSGVPHIGMVVHGQNHARPFVVHNIGAGTRVEEVLFAYTLSGHYRFLPVTHNLR